jgi:hypothetical protein
VLAKASTALGLSTSHFLLNQVELLLYHYLGMAGVEVVEAVGAFAEVAEVGEVAL